MKHIPVRSSGKARAAVGAAALLFGTSGVATRLFAPDLPPATAAGWRIVIGGGLLVLISVVAGRPPWRCSLRRWSIVVGALAFLGFQLGFFLAIGRLGVATATVVAIGTGPIVAGLLDRVLRGTALRGRWWVGVALAIAGIAVMTGANGVTLDPMGVASAVAAGCCFPVFGDAIRDLLADRPPLTAIATVFGAAILPAVVLLGVAGTDPMDTDGTTTALLYLGVVTIATAYLLWSTGLATLTLGDAVTLTMLEPVARPNPRKDQPASSAAHGGFAPAREQVIAETLDANASAASSPSTVSAPSRPPR
jgi:DME family drug/metabolite transporter